MAIVHDEMQSVCRKVANWNTCTSTAAHPLFRRPPCGCAWTARPKRPLASGTARWTPSYKALASITNSSAKLLRYDIRSVTSGTEAMGEATVHLETGRC